jgi:thiamine-monophosphate kinase
VTAACLPRSLEESAAQRLFDAMVETAERYRCPMVGGDVSFWDQSMLLSVTVFAEPAGVEPVLRSGARPGDAICVTGGLGGAWTADGSSNPAGGSEPGEDASADAAGEAERASGFPDAPHHLTFEPRVDLARRLAELPGLTLHSMIDLSDGLASDLTRICERSGVAAELEVDRLPVRPEAERNASRDGRPAWVHALTDGEDYELCFTLDASVADTILPARIEGVPITRVGRILDASEQPTGPDTPVHLRHGDGRIEPLTHTGWEHHG